MLHLFNRVYLKHESVFETNSDSIMARSERKAHPLAFLASFEGAELPSFEEMLQERFENSHEKFWADLIAIPAEQKYSVYVDSKILLELAVQYWKSVFKDPKVESLYRLFSFTILDNKLKSFLLREGRVSNKKRFNESLHYISKEEFAEVFDRAPVIKCLAEMDKSVVGFEYLLANYFIGSSTKYKEAFKDRLGELAWASWFSDIQILRSELLTGFYDLNKILPELKLDLAAPISIEEEILKNKHLAWMLDPKFEESNMDYILRKYDKAIFNDLHKVMVFAKGAEHKKELLNDNQLFFNYQVNLTNLVFDENFEEFLKQDIEDGFGCQLINDHLQQKANQLFVSFVYDKVRLNEGETLKDYELN